MSDKLLKTPSVAPKKSFGQNFLTDQFYLGKIARAIAPTPGVTILEIGAGTGALTKPLLEKGASVIAIEKDVRCQGALEALQQTYPAQLTFILGDALTQDFSQLAPQGSFLVGNLPYNIGTQIVLQGLGYKTHFKKHVYLLQKEVVQRITAHPQTGEWGRLGVACQQLADCHALFDVPPGAFFPPPKVVSGVVCLTPLKKQRYACDAKKLETLTRLAFGQRRKMIRSSLKGIIQEEGFKKVNILPTQRPETLTLKDFAALTTLMS